MLGTIDIRRRKHQKRSETCKPDLTRPANFLAGRRRQTLKYTVHAMRLYKGYRGLNLFNIAGQMLGKKAFQRPLTTELTDQERDMMSTGLVCKDGSRSIKQRHPTCASSPRPVIGLCQRIGSAGRSSYECRTTSFLLE